jgi:hypothetical protein
LFQGIITSPEHEEALTLPKRRFIEYKTVWNDINIMSDPNLHERTTHILLDKVLFPVVKNAPNEYGGEIIIVERKLGIHPLLGNAKKTEIKALKDICGMRWESDNLDSMGGKFFECIIVHVNDYPSKERLIHSQARDLIAPLQCVEGELSIYIFVK